MKNTAYDYLMSGAYMRDGVYTVWYRTYRQSSSKFKYFESLKEAEAWCRRQRGKIIAEAGSWQILDMLKGARLCEL